jgi:hypothetical protein
MVEEIARIDGISLDAARADRRVDRRHSAWRSSVVCD